MEGEDGEETPRTPFWIQSTNHVRRVEVYRRRASSLFFNPGVLIIFLLLFAVLSMVFIVPSLISFTSQIFRPHLVKKSWDSINLVLVLLALAFGFLSRNSNNNDEKSRSDLSTPKWYDFPEQPMRRHRSSSSYPDLREFEVSTPWRFSDDTHLNSHRYYFQKDLPKQDSYAPPSNPIIPQQSPPPALEEESCSSPPATIPGGRKKPITTYHNIAAEDGESSSLLDPPVFQDSERKGTRKRGKGERRRARSSEPTKVTAPINDPTPEPSSPPAFQDSDQKTGKLERKRTGANATKEFFTSFYQKKKKKRQRQRSLDNLDALLHHPQPPVKFQLPPPPTPPPPSVLNNLFTSKKEKRKKILQATSTPPPPPPPPPPRAPKPATTRVSPFITEKPRVPVKMGYFNSIDDSSSGGESPMNRIPPPPPMPPFRMPDWKFAVEGDYVRVQSTLSSGSGSPEGDEAQSPVASPMFCPSPDVDTKADNFIARFRAGLKLEKINSFNQNQGLRMSNLGPASGPSHI